MGMPLSFTSMLMLALVFVGHLSLLTPAERFSHQMVLTRQEARKAELADSKVKRNRSIHRNGYEEASAIATGNVDTIETDAVQAVPKPVHVRPQGAVKRLGRNPTFVPRVAEGDFPILPVELMARRAAGEPLLWNAVEEFTGDLPLGDYFFFSSHNSVFQGWQVDDTCSVEAVRTCMAYGTKIIELDVFAPFFQKVLAFQKKLVTTPDSTGKTVE